jgi:alpha-beta hydrolase superfamily lysophospholipase
VAAAVDALAARFETVHLVGVSWGTMVCGYYLAGHDAPVASLVQCAPVYQPPWSFAEIAAALNVDTDLNAYYHQRYAAVSERQGGDDALFEAIWRTQVESNQGVDPDTYLAQSGALADSKAAAEGELVYDASAVEVPTLVVRGSADAISVREDAVGLYDDFDCQKEYAEIGGADHYAMHGARRRALYTATSAFHDRI